MKMVSFAAIVALLVCLITLMSCGGIAGNTGNSTANSTNISADNSATAKTNVEELGMLVNVPYESDEVFWKEYPKSKKLVAVLRFPPSEAGRLVADAEKIKQPERVNISPQSWFPQELVAQSDMSGEDTLAGQSYAANAFYQEPYTDGRITHIENTDYFVLELSEK